MLYNTPTPPQDSTTRRVAVCVAITTVLALLFCAHLVVLSHSHGASTPA